MLLAASVPTYYVSQALQQWDPVELIALYKKAGTKFFTAMANHHDNMDMFDSTYRPGCNIAPAET